MDTYRISSDDILNKCSNWYMGFKNPGIAQNEKERLMPFARYNVLVHGFHLATAALVYAVACALFANFASALVIGMFGYALRSSINRAFDKMVADNSEEGGSQQTLTERLLARVLWMPKEPTQQEQERLSLLKMFDLDKRTQWVPDFWEICEIVLIKNYAPEPPRSVARTAH